MESLGRPLRHSKISVAADTCLSIDGAYSKALRGLLLVLAEVLQQTRELLLAR